MDKRREKEWIREYAGNWAVGRGGENIPHVNYSQEGHSTRNYSSRGYPEYEAQRDVNYSQEGHSTRNYSSRGYPEYEAQRAAQRRNDIRNEARKKSRQNKR